ncbi:hypothetical protein [Caminibacter sp.]
MQRNSTYYVSLKLILLFLAAVLNSEFIFFPLLIGFVAMGESLLVSVYYVSVFFILHQISLIKGIIFITFLIIFNYYFKNKIEDYINPFYRSVVEIVIVYLFFLILVGVGWFDFLYILYNVAIDIIIYKIIKE